MRYKRILLLYNTDDTGLEVQMDERLFIIEHARGLND